MRYTLSQILEADVNSVFVMNQCFHIPFSSALYVSLISSISSSDSIKTTSNPLIKELSEFSLDLVPNESKHIQNTGMKDELSKDINKPKLNKMIGDVTIDYLLKDAISKNQEREQKEKEIQKSIESRDYDIYTRISYKVMEKEYKLKEMQPVGQKTVDKVIEEINKDSNSQHQLPEWFNEVDNIFQEWRQHKRYLRKYREE